MYNKYMKRVLDLILALILLPILFLITLIVGFAIKIEDNGPVFFNSDRLGKNGVVFKMYKFRSMGVNSTDIRNPDGSTYNSEHDRRLTNVGKFIRGTSIDELPQIINVLIGDMSFIGPRPDLPEHIKAYNENEKRKLTIKPGITGYNQAYYRNAVEWKIRLLNDVYYVDNMTFIMDIKIIINTFKILIFRKNVYIEKEYPKQTNE